MSPNDTWLAPGFPLQAARTDKQIQKVPLNWENGACRETCPRQFEGIFHGRAAASA
jgi:hypothetical protein